MKYDFSKLDDLNLQAMMFDMEVDLETMKIVKRKENIKPVWKERYEQKRADSDFDEYFDIDKE